MRHLALIVLLAGFVLAPRPVHVFVAGDSTAAEKRADRRPETGWAEHLQSYFDTDDVRVVNLARNGRSTRTFIEEGRWDALLEEVRPGDVVLIQFGHNDQSESKLDRYTPPVAFQANLRRFVADVRQLDATPVLLTPIVRGGADVVYDPVGGEQFTAAFRACNPEARYLAIGFASGDVPQIKANHLLVKNISVLGLYWGGYLSFRPEVLTGSLATLLEWYAAGKITPHVSHVLPLEDAAEGLELLRSRASTGAATSGRLRMSSISSSTMTVRTPESSE